MNFLDTEYDVACYCIEIGVVECSAIQKHFGLGFNSTQKIIYELEQKKVLSERQNHGKRSVLVDQEALDSIYREYLLEKQQVFQKLEQEICDKIPENNKEFLLEHDLMKDVINAILRKYTITLDKEDFVNALNFGNLFGYSKGVILFGEKPKIIESNQTSDKVQIIISMDTGPTEYSVVNEIIHYFSFQYPTAEVVFGTSINEKLDGKMELFALLVSE